MDFDGIAQCRSHNKKYWIGLKLAKTIGESAIY